MHPWRVTFSFDSSLQQATAVTPGTQREYEEEFEGLDPENEMDQLDSTEMISGTGTTNEYNKESDIEDINKVFEKTDEGNGGPLLTACHVLCVGGNILNFAQATKQLFDMAIGEDNMLSKDAWIHVFSDQMPPFTMLAFRAQDNQIESFTALAVCWFHWAAATRTTMTFLPS